MNSPLRSLMSGVILFAALNCKSAETNMPDCVGVRPGMSAAEARERLKSYDPQLPVQALELEIPSLGEKPLLETLFVVRLRPPPGRTTEANEILQAAITLPPNKPEVWKVFRFLRFDPGHEQTKSGLFAALHEKYGEESLTTDRGFGTICRYWVRKADGNLLKGPAAQDCARFCQQYQTSFALDATLNGRAEFRSKLRTIMVLSTIQSPPPTGQDLQQCQSMTYVIAELSVSANRELVNEMKIAVIDASLDLRATEATRGVIKAAETAKAKQAIDKAKRQEIPAL